MRVIPKFDLVVGEGEESETPVPEEGLLSLQKPQPLAVVITFYSLSVLVFNHPGHWAWQRVPLQN